MGKRWRNMVYQIGMYIIINPDLRLFQYIFQYLLHGLCTLLTSLKIR